MNCTCELPEWTRARAPLWIVTAAMAGILLITSGLMIPKYALADTSNAQTVCTAYTDDQVWQTSAQWGRVRQRLCVEYTRTDVRAHVQFQTDWPTSCSLSTGIPPSVGAACPVSTLAKLNGLTYKTVNIPIRWQVGMNPTGTFACSFSDVDADNSPGVTTLDCNGAWMPLFHGVPYQVWVDGAQADVKDDGDGVKVLPSETHSFNFS
jgi:hypothetical protein